MEQTNIHKKRINTIIGLLMAVLFLVGFALGNLFSFFTKSDMEKKLEELLQIAQDKGIEAVIDQIGSDEFAVMLVELMLEQDKYAEYYTEEEYKNKQAQGEGNYTGLGVGLAETQVKRVIVNSPAYYAGVKANDILLKGRVGLNQYEEFSTGVQLNEFLSGVENGTKIDFVISRGSETIDVQIEKADYIASYVTVITKTQAFHVLSDADGKVEQLDFEYTIDNIGEDTAYVKLSSFEADAGAIQFAYAMEYVKQNGLTKLALDLSGNGGGRMTVMLNIASYLIYNDAHKSSIVTYVKEKNRTSHQSVVENNFNTDLTKIAVIADGDSASASECLLGAMIYYADSSNQTFSLENLVIENTNGKGTTYGKGIMQTTYELRSGGALKLTTGQLYWPDNLTTIHETGIKVSDQTPQNLVAKGLGIARAIEILNQPVITD